MKTYKTKSGNFYTKKQIRKAIEHWTSVLESLEDLSSNRKFPYVKLVDTVKPNSSNVKYLSGVLPNNPAWTIVSSKNKFQMLIVSDSKLIDNDDYENALAKGIKAVLSEYASRFNNCMFTVESNQLLNTADSKNMVKYDELDVKSITSTIRKYRNMSVGGVGGIFVWDPKAGKVIDHLSISEAPWPARKTLISFKMGNYNGYIIV